MRNGSALVSAIVSAVLRTVANLVAKSRSDDGIASDTKLPPQQRITSAVKSAMSKSSNRDMLKITSLQFSDTSDGQLLATVRFAIDDNFTEGFIRHFAKSEIRMTLQKMMEFNIPFGVVSFEGTMSMSDVKGNTSEIIVVEAKYPRTELDGVNWGNFLTDNVYEIADSVYLHPKFQD